MTQPRFITKSYFILFFLLSFFIFCFVSSCCFSVLHICANRLLAEKESLEEEKMRSLSLKSEITPPTTPTKPGSTFHFLTASSNSVRNRLLFLFCPAFVILFVFFICCLMELFSMFDLFRKCLWLAVMSWNIQMTTFFLNLTARIRMPQQVTHLTLLNLRTKVRIRPSIASSSLVYLVYETARILWR